MFLYELSVLEEIREFLIHDAGILTVHTENLFFLFPLFLPGKGENSRRKWNKFSKKDPITVKKVFLDMCVMDIFTGGMVQTTLRGSNSVLRA